MRSVSCFFACASFQLCQVHSNVEFAVNIDGCHDSKPLQNGWTAWIYQHNSSCMNINIFKFIATFSFFSFFLLVWTIV